ncbi:hypothetical protein Hanom_Chr14g01256041 [Helianthus anomalus]
MIFHQTFDPFSVASTLWSSLALGLFEGEQSAGRGFEYVPPVLNLHSGDFGAVYSNFGHLSSIPLRVKPIANEMLYDRAGLDESFGAFAIYYQLSPFQFAIVLYFLIFF